MSSTEKRGKTQIGLPEYEAEFKDLDDIERFERGALEGSLEQGIYEIDATEVEGLALAHPQTQARYTPGLDVNHFDKDIKSVALVLEGKDVITAKNEFEEYLDREYSNENFLTSSTTKNNSRREHKVTAVEKNDYVLLRACYVCDQ